MTDKEKNDINLLQTGYRFTPSNVGLEAGEVATYLAAVGSDKRLYRDDNVIPPLAVVARALKALFDEIDLPAGTLHIGQGVTSAGVIQSGDQLTSRAQVKRRQQRGKLDMLTISFEIMNQRQDTVMTGETSLILPGAEAAE